MSDDIEVTVTLTRKMAGQLARGTLAYSVMQDLAMDALAALPDPTPPRSEYPLQSVTVTAGCTSVTDLGVSLVPAHSLRSGDEVEWAPGDWRAVSRDDGDSSSEVKVRDLSGAPVWLPLFSLVAVRRSGVTG